MPPQSTIQRSFTGGELTPALHARADQVRYVTGLRRCRNFLVQRHGGVANRPGTRFIAACKTTSSDVALMRYVSETVGESLLWELGSGYLRPYLNGAQLEVVIGSLPAYSGVADYVIGDLVVDGGAIFYALVDNVGVATSDTATWFPFDGELFELPSPFGADLPHWGQSGRVITLTHQDHAPYELINAGSLTAWVLRKVATSPVITAPAGLAVTPGTAGALNVGYVVTAALKDSYEESLPSGQVIHAEVYPTATTPPDALAWTALPNAVEYYVYCDPAGNGIYGYIGTAASNAFTNIGLVPNFLITPPQPNTRFSAAGDYPDRSAAFQQRRFFGNTKDVPDGVFGSRTGFLSNFGVSQPLQSDDAISFRVAGNNHNPIKHMLSLHNLILLTGAGAWVITGGQPGQAIAPNAIDATQETYVGAGATVPVIVGNAIIYVEKLGSTLFDLQFDYQVSGLGGRDLCIFSDHLFKGHQITEMDFAQNPDSIVWCCREDGILLGLTYIREQEIWGWHRHDSAAACRFEHVCVVPEATGDTVYFVTRRTINGGFVRYIEKLESRLIVTFNTDAFFVDAGLSYHGAPVDNVTGLGHLEGQIVAVVGDGAVIFDGDPTNPLAATHYTVTGGTLPHVLPASYSDIHVGLPIQFAEIETLDLDVQGTMIRDKKKRVGSATLLLDGSARTFSVGPDSSRLTRYALKPYETATNQFTGDTEINLPSTYNDNGRIFIRHTDPLPLTILGILPNLELGG